MNSASLSWYVARSAGIVSWALLSASVVWGLALSTKATRRRGPRPNWVLDLHRYLGGAATVFVGVHVLAIVLDSYVHFGLADVAVPLASSWHPVAVAWGIVGAYLLAAVEITSLLRKRLPKRLWRLTHFLSFPLFVLATTHMLSAGTDARAPALVVATITVSALVCGLLAVRLVTARETKPGPPAQPVARPAPSIPWYPTSSPASGLRPSARPPNPLPPLGAEPVVHRGRRFP